MRIEVRRDAFANLSDDVCRQWIEYPVGQRSEQRYLVDETQSGETRLGDQGSDALAARDLRLDAAVG